MSDYRYLKDDSYYNDLYDLHTIETCLEYYWGLKNGFENHRKDDNFKKFTKKQFDDDVHKVASYTVNAIKMDRFRHKKETIEKWMVAAQQRQDRLDNAIEPKGILCSHCDTPMRSTIKELVDHLSEPMKVFFFFECPSCKKRRGIYDDGSSFVSKPPLCPKCKHEAKLTYKKTGKVLSWTTTCPSCGYKEVEKDNSDKWEAERKKKEERDKLLLEKYRGEFYYSEKDGQQAIWDYEQLTALVDKWKERDEHKEEYDAVANIKRLTIVELEKLLNEAITPKGYMRLVLAQPEFGKQLIVGFTVQDSNTIRQEYDSRNSFKKLVQGVLAGTNWRLMIDSVIYRLGYLQGRLKAYETEEDLLNLVKKQKSATNRQNMV
jgi:uncharacterized Zn finger protein (UPF0148 family)